MTSTKEQALAALKILADTNRRQFGSEHPAFAVIRQYIESTSAEAVHRAQPKSTNDMILVSKMKLLHALQHAQMAGDLIVQFSKDEKTKAGMCGYLDDACSSADIAAKDLKEMVNCTPSAPRPGAARRAQLESTEEGRKLIAEAREVVLGALECPPDPACVDRQPATEVAGEPVATVQKAGWEGAFVDLCVFGVPVRTWPEAEKGSAEVIAHKVNFAAPHPSPGAQDKAVEVVARLLRIHEDRSEEASRVIARQMLEVSPAETATPRAVKHGYAVLQTVVEWALAGHISEKGVTCEACGDIRKAVEAGHGPQAPLKITVADSSTIEGLMDLARPFFKDILDKDVDACMLTDESDLSDFAFSGLKDEDNLIREGMSLKESYAAWDRWVIEKILSVYGIGLTTTKIKIVNLLRDISKIEASFGGDWKQ